MINNIAVSSAIKRIGVFYTRNSEELSNSQTRIAGHRNRRLTAIGCLGRIFIGQDTKGDMLRAHANSIIKDVPEASNKMDFYRWYYATLAMFQMGGEYWKTYNEAMKKTFCDLQCMGGCADGSWNPSPGGQGVRPGRFFKTAVATLCLEVYYRYLPVAMMK